MAKLTVYPHTPMPVLRDQSGQPLHEFADDDHRNKGSRRRLYTPNIRISARRPSLFEAQGTITNFLANTTREINIEAIVVEK